MKLIIIVLFICFVIVIDLQEGWALPVYRRMIGTPLLMLTLVLQLLLLMCVVYILGVGISAILKAIVIFMSLAMAVFIPKYFIYMRMR